MDTIALFILYPASSCCTVMSPCSKITIDPHIMPTNGRDPIVIANLPSSNDPDPCVPMIRNVVKGSFDLRCKEPSNLDQVRQKNESIAWMVCGPYSTHLRRCLFTLSGCSEAEGILGTRGSHIYISPCRWLNAGSIPRLGATSSRLDAGSSSPASSRSARHSCLSRTSSAAEQS